MMAAGEIGDAGSSPALPSPKRLQELLWDAARLGRDDVIPALLQAGVDLEAQDARGHSALVLASYHGYEAATTLLLDLGALPDGARGASGNSALMGVAFKGHTAIARRLLAAGANPNSRNVAGQTALMMAALFGRREVVDLLLAAGADRRLVDAAGNDAAQLARAQGNEALAELLEGALPNLDESSLKQARL